MSDLTIGGETFNVKVEGDATRPALMLAHSLGCDLSMWDGLMPRLLKQFRVIRYDSRGHGGSVEDGTPISIARLGRDALAILDALGIDETHFIGLSMGGAVAQWLLAKAPERIARAVLANTAATFGTAAGWNGRIASVLREGMTPNIEATMARWFSPAFTSSAADRVAAVRDVLHRTSPRGYVACCAALRDMDLRESLRSIDRPVLIVTGQDDPVISEAEAHVLADGIAEARHVTLDARHLSNIEAESAFADVVVSFLTTKLRQIQPKKATAKQNAPALAAPITRRKATRRLSAARSPLKTIPEAKPPKRAAPVAKAVAPAKPSKAKAAVTKSAESQSAKNKGAKNKGAERKGAKTVAAKAVPATAAKAAPIKKAPTAVRAKPKAKAAPLKKTAAKNAVPAKKASVMKSRVAVQKSPATKKRMASKASAKRTVVKKAPPKKVAAKKIVAKESGDKKAVAKKAVAKKTVAKKTVTKKTIAKAPAHRTAAKKRPVGRRE